MRPSMRLRRQHRHSAQHPVGHAANLGCVVVRRVTDDRGREWRVRQAATAAGQALLFQCAVPGVPAELRRFRSPLESLSDDELVTELQTAVD